MKKLLTLMSITFIAISFQLLGSQKNERVLRNSHMTVTERLAETDWSMTY